MNLTTYQCVWIGLLSFAVILIFGVLFMWFINIQKEHNSEENELNERLALYANNNHPRIINRRRKK